MKLKDNLYKILESGTWNPLEPDTPVEVEIELCPDSIIYKAHFPGQPITPGVCVSQIAVELASGLLGRDVELTGIKNVKFLSVMTPDNPIVTYSLTITDNKIQAIAKSENTVYAKMSLICNINHQC